MMTLDEAIKHCEEVAEEQDKLCKVNDSFNFSQPKWEKCADEHRQLAEWLKELKQLKEQKPCEDAISRTYLLKKFEDRFIELQKAHQKEKQLGINWCINTLKDMPPVTPTQNWIPVSERLPEPNRAVLTYVNTGKSETFCLANWNDACGDWEEWIGTRMLESEMEYKVLAWMPLPKPYQAERRVKNDKRRSEKRDIQGI